MNENGTTIWIDRETKEDLQKIADLNGRSIVGQIRWMVSAELESHGLENPASADDLPETQLKTS